MTTPIGLGTVEIGIPYGIGQRPFPTDQEAERLLKSAVEMGVEYFDTARPYGLAEERIGKSGIAKMPGVIIGTKCGHWLKKEPELRGQELRKRIREDVETSRQLLDLDTLPLLQLHLESPIVPANLTELFEILGELQHEHKVGKVGVASRGSDVPKAALEFGSCSSAQVAYSILDQRMANDVLPLAQINDKNIICRSVFLQGVLSGSAQFLPPDLRILREQAEAVEHFGRKNGYSLAELATRFVLAEGAIQYVLVGTTSVVHLRSAIECASHGMLPAYHTRELQKLGLDDPKLVDPAQWPK